MLDTIEKIKHLLQENINYQKVKNFYIGDPIWIPHSSLPAIIIAPQSASLTVNDTAHDMYEQHILISLEVDKKSEMNKTPDEVVAERTLMEKAVGRDATTSQFKADSIIGILRKNFTLEQTVENQFADIEWGVKPRGENWEVITASVQIKFTVRELVLESRT